MESGFWAWRPLSGGDIAPMPVSTLTHRQTPTRHDPKSYQMCVWERNPLISDTLQLTNCHLASLHSLCHLRIIAWQVCFAVALLCCFCSFSRSLWMVVGQVKPCFGPRLCESERDGLLLFIYLQWVCNLILEREETSQVSQIRTVFHSGSCLSHIGSVCIR